MKAALYVRVSTKGQTVTRQIHDLEEYAARQNLEVTHIIQEQESAFRKDLYQRPSIQKLLELVNGRAIDKVLVSEISRLGRKTQEVLQILQYLMEKKVSLVVLNLGIDTFKDNRPDPYAQFLITVIADLGRLESENLSYRIKSGLKKAKKLGRAPGRPQGAGPVENTKNYKAIKRLIKEGYSVRKVALIAGVSVNTVRKVKEAIQ